MNIYTVTDGLLPQDQRIQADREKHRSIQRRSRRVSKVYLASTMHLYNVSLSSPSAVTAAVVGQFSGTRQQEIVVCRGGARLELFRPDTSVSGKAQSIFEQHAFGIIRSLASFRLTGGSKGESMVA